MEGEMDLSKKSLASLILLVGILMGLMTSSVAYDFYVGGRDGWVPNPSESYGEWAGRNRFQVNDTLVFKYRKGMDSVLVVTKQDYDACNVSNPIQKLEGGDSAFKFGRTGPFYFISGVPENCRKGQKLEVVVLALRNKTPTPSPPSPSPSSASSPSLSPGPSPSPSSLTPFPSIAIPPASAPASGSPSPSPPPISSPSSVVSASRITFGLVALILGGALLY